ncbi:MAG TPA: ATP phosphoribosyltransferase regulatory subunit [Dehalococcoidales bacterium]|nr:ATP phosphoribosyltransferase regulatory subunit [Dehalococcoidales bacterium]
MRVQRCKGMRDLSPAEMKVFGQIEGLFRDGCLKWGYEEVRTPTIESLHLFTSTGTLTPGMLGRVYSFLDWDGWSGERVVLRPDGTIPVARFYIDSMADKGLAKLFYITNTFIFEETGKENREKWQGGAELIGVNSVAADMELVILALEVLQSLGIKGVELRLSHAGVIRALLTRLGLSPEEQASLFDQILEGNTRALARLKPGDSGQKEALALLLERKEKSTRFLREAKALSPEIERPLNNLIEVAELLEALGYDYLIDIASGRGFEYYTGVIFQLSAGNKKIGGGGRYDALIPLMGGKDVPASGFALYLNQLMKLLKPKTELKTSGRKILIRAKADRPEILTEGFSLAKSLHGAGYTAEIQLGDEAPADLRWTIEIQDKAPRFILTDRAKNRKSGVQSVAEIQKLLDKESE